MPTLCADCHIHPAVVKRGKQAVCVDCFNEQPLAPLAQWDSVMTPARILALEARVAEVEKSMEAIGDVLDGLDTVLKDVVVLGRITNERLDRLESIIANWTAEK